MSTGIIDGNVQGLQAIQLSLNPASVAANTTAEQSFTVPGLRATDFVIAFVKPTASAGLGIVNYRVSAANTLAVTFVNATASPIDAAAEIYTVVVLRPDGGAYGSVQ